VPCHTQQSKQGRLLWVWSKAGKEIKLEDDAISEIVVANTDPNFEEEEGGGGRRRRGGGEEEQQKQQQKQ